MKRIGFIWILLTIYLLVTNLALTQQEDGACSGDLRVEAESGVLHGQFAILLDLQASGRRYIEVPRELEDILELKDDNRVDYCFDIAETAAYRIKVWTMAPSVSSDSFFVTVNGLPYGGYLFDVPLSESYVETYVTQRREVRPVEIVLTRGRNVISFHLRETGTRLDKLELEPVTAQAVELNCGGLEQEAEHGNLLGFMSAEEDVRASGGYYVHAPKEAGFVSDGPPNDKVVFCVNMLRGGNYQIRAWVQAANESQDSFYVTVNGEPAEGYLWDVTQGRFYSAQLVKHRGRGPLMLRFPPGQHIIVFHLREPETRLDKIRLEWLSF